MSAAKLFFTPGERLADRLGINNKIALIALLFLLPLGLLMWRYVALQLDNLTFTSSEKAGIQAIAPAGELLHEIQTYRREAISVGKWSADASLSLKSSDQKIGETLANTGVTLGNTPELAPSVEPWKAIAKEWSDFKASSSSLSVEDGDKQLSKISQHLLGFIGKTADQQNLTLDPDMDTYYAMDLTVLQLPSLMAFISDQRSKTNLIVANKDSPMASKISSMATSLLIEEHMDSLKTDLSKLKESNPDVSKSLEADSTPVDAKVSEFSDTCLNLMLGGTADDKGIQSLNDSGDAAIEALAKLQRDGLNQFGRMLEKRVDNLHSQVLTAGLSVLVAFLIALYFFFSIRRTVSRGFNLLESGLHRMSLGNLGSSFNLTSTDELGRISGDLEAMRTQLKQRIDGEREIAAENQAVRQALDSFSSCVRITDPEGTVTYINRAMKEKLKELEPALKEKFPSFTADTFLGSKVSLLKACKADGNEKGSQSLRIVRRGIHFGGQPFTVTQDPIVDSSNKIIAYVSIWREIQHEIESEKRISEVLEKVRTGHLSNRIETSDLKDFYKLAGEGMNALCDIVAKSMGDLERVLKGMAEGDLTQRIENEYEGTFGRLRDSANTTMENLTEIVSQIKEATDTISTASAEIAEGNSDLSNRTEQQAASLEQTSSSMEELSSTVNLNSGNAQQANLLAKGASDVAVKGGNVVGQVVHTMGEINESSKKIADIIGVIDGIAFQTNILALNAAVEAARAGEQGRGFAVVATEVRNLAQRSAAAAKEIKVLIDDSVSKVGNGTKLVDEAGRTMEEVVTSIKRVTDIMAEISAASNEQSAGIALVKTAVEQMDGATQQNAALVEEAAAAAESMEEQTRVLGKSVSVFKISENVSTKSLGLAVVPKRPKMVAITKPVPKRMAIGSEAESWEEF